MAYEPLPELGQAASAASLPVVIANDQSAVPVSGTVTSNLGTLNGAATSAKQDTIIGHVDGIETLLGTIDTDTGAIATSAASIDTKTPALGQALAAASVPVILPAATITTLTPQTDALTDTELRATPVPVSGTVTANLSATDNTVLDNIDTSTAAINTKTPALGQALAAASVPVVLTAAQITTLTPPAAITGFATETTLAAVKTAVETIDNAISGSEMQVDIVGALPAGTNNIGDVDVLSLPALPAGNNNIGDVDIASIAAGDNNIGNVDVVTLPSIPAGTNNIGDVDVLSLPAIPAGNNNIGDVDVASIAAGTNTIGGTYCVPNTTGGLSTFNATSSDGATALTSTAQVIKASAGQLFGWYLYNPNATAQFVQLYNTAAASVTVGTTSPLFMLTVPAGAAANVMSDVGITFSNAGWSCAATSTAGGSGAPSTALDCVFFYK